MTAAAAPQLYAEVEQYISDVNLPTMGKSVVEKTGPTGGALRNYSHFLKQLTEGMRIWRMSMGRVN